MTDLIELPAAFWAKVQKTETCWLWTGSASDGYGRYTINGEGSRLVHRLAYAALVGPIPPGLTIDHVYPQCTSTLCVRPDHLEPVTLAENTRRAWAANPSRLSRVAAAILESKHERMWGYDLMKASGLKSGALYPALRRMVDKGWLVSGWADQNDSNPQRRYYELTKTGHDFLGGIQ